MIRIKNANTNPLLPKAKRALNIWLPNNAANQKEKAIPSNITVGEAVDRYIASKSAVLSPTTIDGYKRIRKNVLQGLIDIKLSDLTTELIQNEVNKAALSISPKSIKNAYGLFSTAIKAYKPGLNGHRK